MTSRALIPTVSSFPPLDSCPPSAMHYKRLIMTVTAPQVCGMLDLLFGSQASLSLPSHHLHSLARTSRRAQLRVRAHTRAHARSHCSQLLCQQDSGASEKGILHESAWHDCSFIVLPNHEVKKNKGLDCLIQALTSPLMFA